jgi:hypothetical protein
MKFAAILFKIVLCGLMDPALHQHMTEQFFMGETEQERKMATVKPLLSHPTW